MIYPTVGQYGATAPQQPMPNSYQQQPMPNSYPQPQQSMAGGYAPPAYDYAPSYTVDTQGNDVYNSLDFTYNASDYSFNNTTNNYYIMPPTAGGMPNSTGVPNNSPTPTSANPWDIDYNVTYNVFNNPIFGDSPVDLGAQQPAYGTQPQMPIMQRQIPMAQPPMPQKSMPQTQPQMQQPAYRTQQQMQQPAYRTQQQMQQPMPQRSMPPAPPFDIQSLSMMLPSIQNLLKMVEEIKKMFKQK